jgi:glycosyltransferase involved in cell wall biosynthesis
MNVIFDPQIFSFQEYGGISQYFQQLFKCFVKMEGISPEILIRYSNNQYLNEFDDIHIKHFFPFYRFKGRNEIIKLLNRIYVRNTFRRKPAPDLFHPTYYHPYFLDLLGNIPSVLTIYDMAHEHYPQMFSKYDYTIKNKRNVAGKVNRIISISENTKADIISILKIPASQIDVIPLASTLSLDVSKKPSFSLPENFILYVGKRNTYKNFLFLLQAFSSFLTRNNKLTLVCAGGGILSRQELMSIESLQLTNNIIQMKVDDATLAYLYSKAKAFVHPSLYEGFGIPVLEAFTCGCPAILSNKSSLPEVGGDAAQYFDPENIESLTTKMAEVLESSTLSDSMKSNGFRRSKLFSWENTAQKTLETYRKVV